VVHPQDNRRTSIPHGQESARRFGRYTLVKKLATGGMAEIWLARQRGLAGFNRFVVIKKILPHLSEQNTFRQMFLDEARTSAQLTHPNIVQIYDLGQEGDSYFIAMEFIAGENLAAIAWRGVKRKQPLPVSYAAQAIADSCKALHYAHHLKSPTGQALEIVHRDISPQNILVTYEGEIKLVDFGIAKAASRSESTKTGMLKGKFSYMSPEQCLGASVDMRSDIFALGIILYELCTGKRLFKHESELMILEMITKRTIPPPSRLVPGLSERLEAVIMKALEKDVGVRFQTGQEMQIALEDYLRSEAPQVSSADLANYMRGLFADKIEEKRKLKEIASQDDFDGNLGQEEEATEHEVGQSNPSEAPGRRRVVHGLSPSEVARANGGRQMAQTGTFGQRLPIVPPTPSHSGFSNTSPSGGLTGNLNGPLTVGSPWQARLIIGFSFLVIVVTIGFLIANLWYRQSGPTPPPPPTPMSFGRLSLESVPLGAGIYLNDEPMILQSNGTAPGEIARTPSDLTGLSFGQTYRIRMEKDGYHTFETTVAMDGKSNGQTIRPQLEAYPGRLVVEVVGDYNKDAVVYANDKSLGKGPRISQQMPGDSLVEIRATVPSTARVRCTVDPAKARIRPRDTLTVSVNCERSPEPPSRPRETPTITQPGPGQPPKPTKDAPGGCRPRSDQPPGFVTINTKPYAELFIEGQSIGETPISKKRLPAGCIELTAVDRVSGRKTTKRITVQPYEITIFDFEF
jgi:eukaryotic-like serine/threonine-protein kinase